MMKKRPEMTTCESEWGFFFLHCSIVILVTLRKKRFIQRRREVESDNQFMLMPVRL